MNDQTSITQHSVVIQDSVLSPGNTDPRPFLIGYAFGRRKTKSMGAVMLKVSKAISSVMMHTPSVTKPGQSCSGDSLRQHTDDVTMTELRIELKGTVNGTASTTPNAIIRKPEENLGNAENEDNTVVTEDESSFGSSLQSRRSENGMPVILSCNRLYSSTDRKSKGSSAPDEEVHHAYCTYSSSYKASTPSSGTTSLSSRTDLDKKDVDSATRKCLSDNSQTKQPIPVSIVPLDLNIPIEDQHGGKFDVILHKLTEDILYKYLPPPPVHHNVDISMSTPTSNESGNRPLSTVSRQSLETDHEAIQRLRRLTKYKLDHPACCILDHPNNVQAVFSRCDIACTLSECLKGATSKSGLPVRTPRFHVLRESNKGTVHSHKDIGTDDGNSGVSTEVVENESIVDEVMTQINNGLFNFPLIAKPLTAAGTVESHEMAVVLNKNGLKKLHSPCFLQEYANHDELLFKVFVLGDKTWVFPRPSLPNLPSGELLVESSDEGFIEFDSQKPYPKASDFAPSRNNVGSSGDDFTCSKDKNTHRASVSENLEENVTAEEMQPIAECLRRAFGLELFGFDVLVVQNYQCKSKPTFHRKQIFVVDVNYFPSYKEVDNFPKVLATYLTKFAIEGRLRSFD